LNGSPDNYFKDVYLFEFLDLPSGHSEADLHHSLIANLGRFLTELGRDFCYVGSEYPVQVGGQDFALDLLFFHRGLNCLVAVDLLCGRPHNNSYVVHSVMWHKPFSSVSPPFPLNCLSCRYILN
jgi:predicted nuclease of restriction endonuclease-like (RecB) superfamily